MNNRNNILFFFILASIGIFNPSYFGQNKLNYKILEEFNSPIKEIGGLAVLRDSLILYNINENKISIIDLLTQKQVNSLILLNDSVMNIAIDPLTKRIIGIDKYSNLLTGNLNYSSAAFSIRKNLNDFNSGINLINKARNICFAKESYFISTDDGWSSGIYLIKNDLKDIEFFSYTMGEPPVTLTFDGNNIWSLSKKNSINGGGILCKYDTNGVLIAFVEIDLREPSNIYCDGQYFWLTENTNNKIIKIDIIEGGK